MRWCWVLLAAVLAGCAAEPKSPVQVACEGQVFQDPAVQSLIMKGAGSEHFQLVHQDELAYAKKAAVVKCMQARGAIPRGGVEAQKPLK